MVTSGADITALEAPMPKALATYDSPVTPKQQAATSIRSRTPNSRPLHEELLERGAMYQQRREALQERAIADEMKRCRSVPKISQMGREIERNESIVTRLYKVQKEKEKMHKFKLMQIDKKDEELQQSWFHPKISRRGTRALGRSMEQQHEMWNLKRQERLEEQRRQMIIHDMQHVQDGPDINPMSEKLAMKRREREGLAGYSHIDAMIERERLAKLALWEKHQAQYQAEHPGTPRITAYAAGLPDERNVVDRLYERERLRQAKLAHREKQARDEVIAMQSPTITAASHMLQSQTIDYGEDILTRHQRKERERDERLEQRREEERRRHTPKIDPISDAIAARLPLSTFERLSQPLAHRRDGGDEAQEGAASPERIPTRLHAAASATPRGTPRASTPPASSARRGSPTRPSEHELSLQRRMEAMQTRREERLQAAAAERSRQELAECTFHPKVSPLSARLAPADEVTARQLSWAQRRDEKLEAHRQASLADELTECTFRPQTHHEQSSPHALRPGDLYGGDGRAWGYQAHVERLDEARRVNVPADRPATSWTGAPTVPSPPVLGSRPPVAALSPPVRPPTFQPTAPMFMSGSYDAAPARAAAEALMSSTGLRMLAQTSPLPSAPPSSMTVPTNAAVTMHGVTYLDDEDDEDGL